MNRIVKLKNATEIDDVWAGQLIVSNEYFLIENSELPRWQNDSKVFQDIALGKLVVNDGDSDFLPNAGWTWLMGNVIKTEPVDRLLTTDVQIPKVAVYKAEGSSLTRVTHNFTDKTTWYYSSVQVLNKQLTLVSDKNYSCGHSYLIDAIHGKIYDEDSLTSDGRHYKIRLAQGLSDDRIYKVQVFDDANLLTEDVDYTVNYATGVFTISDNYTILGNLTASYYKATNATYVLAPKPGKILVIEHSEIQLSTDCEMTASINFEVWINHPDQENFPGVKIPFQILSYKNIKDLLSSCNRGTGTFPGMYGLNTTVVVLPFDYITVKPFKSSLGAELRITMDSTSPLSGDWATATFYAISLDE
jgi:hypothetical protein